MACRDSLIATGARWRTRNSDRTRQSGYCDCRIPRSGNSNTAIVPPNRITSSAFAPKKHWRCEKLHTADLPFELQTSWGAIRGETSMLRSHTNSQRSHGIWPKAPALSATQMVILLADLGGRDFRYRPGAGRFPVADRSQPRHAGRRSGNCPQLAETFDSQRAACLRRRWSAMRNMRPWPDSSENAILEECLRSPGGEIAVPFRTNAAAPRRLPRGCRRAN